VATNQAARLHLATARREFNVRSTRNGKTALKQEPRKNIQFVAASATEWNATSGANLW
jgi:hypothetical protein